MTLFDLGNRYRILGTILAAAMFCFPGAIMAQPQLGGPCAETVEKYCRDVVPGAGRVMKCLNDHRDDQSPFCKDWIAEQQKSLKELNTSCYEEIAKLCRIDPPDEIRIFLCLNDNYAGLKLDCRDKLREIKDRLQ